MYYTVKGDGNAELSVKHSKFLAFCARVSDEEQAETFVKSVKKRFTDATRAPYAYLLGERADKSRASDDGEPSGTSGVPILESIKNAGLTDTAVVVVRYFGGIKLGTGGLARAYGDAATEALKLVGKSAFEKCVLYRLSCDYGLISSVQTQVYSFGMILNSEYGDGATIIAAVCKEKYGAVVAALADATSGKVIAEQIEERYCEVK